jgi:murein lipoprotein
MKKSLLMISIMLALAIAVGGCATKGDLEDVQAREKAIGAKADQAEEAERRAEEAERRAEERERIAAEKERIAEEKAKQAEAAFQKSMKK